MTQHAINRREFVALSTAAAATAAISSTSIASTSSAALTRPLNIPAPSLALVIPSNSTPSNARLQPVTHTRISTTKLIAPLLTITPLACIENRLAPNASIMIEAYHPVPNIYTNLLRAHNSDIPGQSIPDFASTSCATAPRNTLGQTTLRITQRINNASKSNLINLSTTASGAYLLAIPTASNSANAAWRFTSATLDRDGNITALNNLLSAASSRCAYFSITVQEQQTDELPTSNLDDISSGE